MQVMHRVYFIRMPLSNENKLQLKFLSWPRNLRRKKLQMFLVIFLSVEKMIGCTNCIRQMKR